METQDITAVLPSGKQQTVTLAVSAKVQELKEILQRCFDQQFLVILDARGQAVMLQLDHAILIGSEFQVEAANARTFRIAQQATFKELRLRKLLGRIAEAQNQQSRGRQPPAILIRRIFSHPFVVREGLQSLGEAREWAQQELRSHVQSTQTEQLQAWRERMRNSSAKPLGCVAQPPDAMGGQVPTVWKSIRQILLQKPNAKLRDTDHALPAKDLRPIAIQSVIWRAIASAWTRRPQTRAWVTSWVHSSACGGIQGKSVDTSIPQGDAISPLTLLAVLTGLTGRVLQARPEPHTLVTFLDDRNMVAKTPELAARLWDTWKQLSPKVGLKENEEKIQIVARQAAFKPRLIAAGFDETHIVQGTWLGTVRSWLQSLNWHEEVLEFLGSQCLLGLVMCPPGITLRGNALLLETRVALCHKILCKEYLAGRLAKTTRLMHPFLNTWATFGSECLIADIAEGSLVTWGKATLRDMAGCARGSFFVQKLRGWDGVPREGDSQKPKLAKAPASEALQASTSPQRGPDRCSLAQRLAAGRTLELLTTLMVVHFLKICAAKVTQLQPRGGLFAFRDDQPVFILSVWTSRKITLADVVPLKQATFQGRTVLKAKYTETRTCRWSELKDVGLHFQVANCANDRRGASLLFQKQPGEHKEIKAHLAERAASGITHHAAPRADESRSFWILDLPLPVQVDGRRHRCHTRALVEQICGNALSLNVAGRMKEFCSAVPKSVSIRSILMAALEDYTKAASREMQRLINVYSGSVIRGDGNQDVAKRITMYDEAGQKTHPYTVLLAWVTVDGALFQPVTAAETEDWVDLQPDLDAVVTNLKQDRLASGLSLAEAAPVAHATDSFRKQRLLLDAFYKNKYPKEQEVEACLQPSYAEIRCMTSWRYSAR
ncbi:unnamed protein product [Cladocopium goreaui]|uniref:Reverse transcriptase domain-containing protein n=1 Tax=Cladocopium goreaui TaxID=2562237 RepID=A0A9P1GN19_9DINO|nr:unnamed protein product [Cladocopium goreaui]